MLKRLLHAALAICFALASGMAAAQAPPALPEPKLPAMPSLEQKGSDDMTKPAGAMPPAPKPAPEPKRAGRDLKKHEPDAPKGKPKPAARSKAPTKPAAEHAVSATKGHKPPPKGPDRGPNKRPSKKKGR